MVGVFTWGQHDKYIAKRKVMIAELETEATRNYHPDKKTKTMNAELGADKSLFDGVEVDSAKWTHSDK